MVSFRQKIPARLFLESHIPWMNSVSVLMKWWKRGCVQLKPAQKRAWRSSAPKLHCMSRGPPEQDTKRKDPKNAKLKMMRSEQEIPAHHLLKLPKLILHGGSHAIVPMKLRSRRRSDQNAKARKWDWKHGWKKGSLEVSFSSHSAPNEE